MLEMYQQNSQKLGELPFGFGEINSDVCRLRWHCEDNSIFMNTIFKLLVDLWCYHFEARKVNLEDSVEDFFSQEQQVTIFGISLEYFSRILCLVNTWRYTRRIRIVPCSWSVRMLGFDESSHTFISKPALLLSFGMVFWSKQILSWGGVGVTWLILYSLL